MPGLRLLANNESGMLAVDFGSAGASPSQVLVLHPLREGEAPAEPQLRPRQKDLSKSQRLRAVVV